MIFRTFLKKKEAKTQKTWKLFQMFDIKSWIPNIFLLIIFFSSLSCFSRPDYNLPLFIFAYMIWFLPNVQHFFENKPNFYIFRVKKWDLFISWYSPASLISFGFVIGGLYGIQMIMKANMPARISIILS